MQNINMTTNPSLQDFYAYEAFDATEKKHQKRIIQFLEKTAQPYHRETTAGHMTASCWVVSPDHQQVLMMHHRKLDKWLQIGGHADGETNLIKVARQELEEESGAADFQLQSTAIFDVDVHLIPARKQEPEHFHHDVRFLFKADPNTLQLHPNHESKAMQWVRIKQIETLTQEPSILRMVEKMKSHG